MMLHKIAALTKTRWNSLRDKFQSFRHAEMRGVDKQDHHEKEYGRKTKYDEDRLFLRRQMHQPPGNQKSHHAGNNEDERDAHGPAEFEQAHPDSRPRQNNEDGENPNVFIDFTLDVALRHKVPLGGWPRMECASHD